MDYGFYFIYVELWDTESMSDMTDLVSSLRLEPRMLICHQDPVQEIQSGQQASKQGIRIHGKRRMIQCPVIRRCMRKRNITDVYIRLVQDMYKGATTWVNSKRGIIEHFAV